MSKKKDAQAKHKYLVLGAGRQGVAAAYDLALWGAAAEVTLADESLQVARRAARRVGSLSGKNIFKACRVDAADLKAASECMKGHDVVLSAVPYFLNSKLSQAAVRAKSHFCDLGGNLGVVRKQLSLHGKARRAGISIVPDCGLAPGAANILGVYAMEEFVRRELGRPHSIHLYCGGLPQNPQPPLGYQLSFSMEGLLNEYEGESMVLRNGKVVAVETLTEVESIDFPGSIGRAEAFVTSGGTSLGPWNLKGRITNYEYKTVRFPGHVTIIKAMRDLGLFERKRIQAGGVGVSPRDVFKAMVGPKLAFPDEKDQILLRVVCKGGAPKGKAAELKVDLVDYEDSKTGFSAMERTTGFSAAIVMHLLAEEKVSSGARTADAAVPGKLFYDALKRRGFSLKTSVRRAR